LLAKLNSGTWGQDFSTARINLGDGAFFSATGSSSVNATYRK